MTNNKLKYYVAGHNGMVGSALVRLLKTQDIEIVTKEKSELNLLNQNEVKHFYEKPQTSDGFINGGYFVANKEIFDFLDDNPKLVFEEGPLNRLSNKGLLGCYPHYGFWHPMDTYKEFLYLNKMWKSGAANWKIW